jgi:hypothetical protein
VQTDGLEEWQPRARTVPLLTDASVLTGKPRELIMNLKFRNPLGSPADASFIVYLGYTDTNMIFKDKKFSIPYGLFLKSCVALAFVDLVLQKCFFFFLHVFL